jgi:hypothetical protein
VTFLAKFPWFLPVVAVIAAVALGATGAIVGMNFATPTTAVSSAPTEVVPVLEPSAVGETAISTLPAPDAAKSPKNLSHGQAQITVPEESSTPDPIITSVIDAAAHATDPALPVIADSFSTATSGDACALLPAPTGCPPGLLGSVGHILHTPPDFTFYAAPFPHVASGSTLAQLHCDANPAGAVPVGVWESVPAGYQISVHPVDDSRTVTILPRTTPTAAEISAFRAAVDAADETHPLERVTTCLNLAGLQANTGYVATAIGTDYLGRAAAPYSFRFNTSGAPVHPGAQITTMGDNLVLVRALHSSEESVAIRAWTLHPHASADCSAPAGDELRFFTTAETSATADEVTAQNAPDNFTARSTVTFDAPEGSTILVCARWFPSGSAPSWAQATPIYESRSVLQSPDRILPRVTVEHVSSFTVLQAGISAATVEGTPCGQVAWNSVRGLPANATLCDTYTLARGGLAYSAGNLWDRGFSGDISVTATTAGSGERNTSTILLPLSRQECFGNCALPDPSVYYMYLPADSSYGYVQLRVDWAQGNQNGRTTWSQAPTVDRTLVTPPPSAFPQLNINAEFSVTHLRQDQDWAQASWTLESDRDSAYDLKLTQQSGVAAPSCAPGGGVLEWHGDVRHGVSQFLQFDGLCLGTNYRAEITLDDRAGHVANWGESDLSTWWGDTSHVHVPGVRVRLQYVVDAQGIAPGQLDQLSMTVAGVSLPNGVDDNHVCSETGHFHGEDQQEVVLSSHTPLRVQLRISPVGLSSQLFNEDGTAAGALGCTDGDLGRLITIPLTIDLSRSMYLADQDQPCLGETLTATTPYPFRFNVCALYEGMAP